MDRAAEAAAAADAYRMARVTAEAQQGAPLSAVQHQQLAKAFKDQLTALGLDSTNLKGL